MNNVLKLQAERIAQVITEGRTINQILKAVSSGEVSERAKEAAEFVRLTIAAVRQAPDSDPSWTDEDIAGKILEELEKKRCQARSR